MTDVEDAQIQARGTGKVDAAELEKHLSSDISAQANVDLQTAGGMAREAVPTTETAGGQAYDAAGEAAHEMRPAMVMTPGEQDKNAEALSESMKGRMVTPTDPNKPAYHPMNK